MLASHHSATVHMHDQCLSGHAAAPQESDKIRLRREAKKGRGFYVEDEAKLVFVVRIRGINDMHPKVGLRVFAMVLVCRTFCRSLAHRCRNAVVSDRQTH